MATLTNGDQYTGNITIVKQTGTVVTLHTEEKYVPSDIQLTIGVQSGAGAAGSASADASVESTDDSSIGGVNISGVIGTKATSEPTSGYYIRVKAIGSGNSTVSTAGWLGTGALATASAESTMYFPVTAASITTTGGGLTPTGYSATPEVALALSTSTMPSGVNITDTQPSSGYYATLVGSSEALSGSTSVQRAAFKDTRTAGYLPARAETIILASETSNPSVTISAGSKTRYLTIAKAEGSNTITGGAVSCTYQTGTGVTLSNSTNNSGVSVTFRGSRAVATATTSISTNGYISSTDTAFAGELAASTADTTYYINGVTITPPTTGTRTFAITVPNGDSTVTFNFNVDSSGNVVID